MTTYVYALFICYSVPNMANQDCRPMPALIAPYDSAEYESDKVCQQARAIAEKMYRWKPGNPALGEYVCMRHPVEGWAPSQ